MNTDLQTSALKLPGGCELRAGDCLLYFARQSPVDWAIALKTWNYVAHVETFVGGRWSVAARNGQSVNLWPLRLDGLAAVRRPNQPFDLAQAMAWFNVPYDAATHQGIRGQGYDWKGLLCFTLAVSQGSPDKMFCSEFCTRFYERGGLGVFAPDYDADKIAPAQFLQTPALTTVWDRKHLTTDGRRSTQMKTPQTNTKILTANSR